MSNDLLPEYDYALETALILRCTVCSGWWSLTGGDPTRVYTCPYCGVRLSPPQYPDDPPRQRHSLPDRQLRKEVGAERGLGYVWDGEGEGPA